MQPQETTPIKPEELQAALKAYAPERPLVRERDMLAGRYRISINEPLPALSSSMAKAFAARDSQSPELSLYALVFDANAMPRKKNIAALKEFRHPNIVSLLADGIVEISIYSESRYVVILERPVGTPLSELLATTAAQKNPVLESTVINYLIRPFTEILKSFAEMGISHNRINLKNVYIHNATLHLGECVSEPSGYSQDFLFEPIDRMLCSRWGRHDFAIDADCYALGVLALHLLLGFQPFAGFSEEAFMNRMLARGSYHTLVIQWDISENLQDLFRALLNDAKRDRCAPEHIINWLGGRRFNLILPSISQETARPFDLAGQSHFNRKILAHAMFQNWGEARNLLFDTRLPRWLETSVHKKEVADAVSRIASGSLGDTAKAERHNNELLARIIITLDPHGPVRFKNIAFMPDGAGTLLAHLYFTDDKAGIQEMLQAIESDLAGHWIEAQKAHGDTTQDATKLQRMRNFLRMRSPGFGIERCLYDYFPSLACQSPLVKKMNVTTLQELLLALDTIAPLQRDAAETDFMDKHIAAFIASRLELSKEVRIHELDEISELAANPQLVSLKLLGRAQQKAGNKPVPGLTQWIALRLFPMLDYIHRRAVRNTMQAKLREAAGSGIMASLSGVLLNPDVFLADYHSYQKAFKAYAQRRQQIARLNNTRERTKHARMVGRGLAQTLAYGTSLFTVYFTLRAYYHI